MLESMKTTPNKATGLKNADELIEVAMKAGLKVTVNTKHDEGDDLVTGHTSVTVQIEMHCPKAYAETMLGVDIRAESLIAFFYKSHRKGSRAKFTGAERRSLYGGGRKIATLRRLMWQPEFMGADMARHFERAGEDLPQPEPAPERPATKVVLVSNGCGAGYKSTDGVWDIAAHFGRRKRGVAPSRPAFFTVRHIATDTELEGTYRNISAVRQAFSYGKISAPGAVVCRDAADNPFTSHDFTPDGIGKQCRRCAAPRAEQVLAGGVR